MQLIPSWPNALLALLAAGLLIVAFPDFELWWVAWFALVPLLWAVEREKGSTVRSFLLGWLFGTAFFFGTGWWLTYAPIHYAAVPWPVAYFLIFIVALILGIFPGVFTAILSLLLRRFGSWAFLAAPFVWVFTEFLRYWITGNKWNAIGYSQAFTVEPLSPVNVIGIMIVPLAAIGGTLCVGFVLLMFNAVLAFAVARERWIRFLPAIIFIGLFILAILIRVQFFPVSAGARAPGIAAIVAIQPNVPMSGMNQVNSHQLRQQQIELAEAEIAKLQPANGLPITVVLPESPMNFMYNDDLEFQQFIGAFARRNNVSVLFNSAEPDASNGRYYNSAVMVGPDGKEVAQYDKVYLLPFGEAVPAPLEAIVPAFVGNFSYGQEYDLFPVGDAKAGVMICFESHFGQLSRKYVSNGADVIIEMTNDGYLGPTPVLRQHLANAVFRAVETNRPVLRVTNVGITAYIDAQGTVSDQLPVYQEGTRVWTVSKSDGSQTFYVKYGDWFAWLCTVVTIMMIILSIRNRKKAISD
jgi:apolipoprotein N-acyltransferase